MTQVNTNQINLPVNFGLTITRVDLQVLGAPLVNGALLPLQVGVTQNILTSKMLLVFANGLLQRQGLDYINNPDGSITVPGGASVGDLYTVLYFH